MATGVTISIAIAIERWPAIKNRGSKNDVLESCQSNNGQGEIHFCKFTLDGLNVTVARFVLIARC